MQESKYQLVADNGDTINLMNCKAKITPILDGRHFIEISAEINKNERPFLSKHKQFSYISPEQSAITAYVYSKTIVRLYTKYSIKLIMY